MYENLWMKFKSYFAQSLPTGDHENPHVVVRGQVVLTKTLLWLNRSRRISKKNNFYKKINFHLKITGRFSYHADFTVDLKFWRLENIPFSLPNFSVVPSKFHNFPPRVWESLRRRKHEILRITKFYSTCTRRTELWGICSFDFSFES